MTLFTIKIVEPGKVRDMIKSIVSEKYNRLVYLFGLDYGYEHIYVNYFFALAFGEKGHIVIRCRIDKADPRVDSVSDIIPSAMWPEREWSEMMGIKFVGARDLRRLFLPSHEHVVEGRVIRIGPYHPMLLEGIMISLAVKDGVIVDADVKPGYSHRGVMKLAETRSWRQNLHLVERVCGICSVAHSICYANVVERLFGVEAPPRAKLLRTLVAELNRIQSHILAIAVLMNLLNDFNMFKKLWILREDVLKNLRIATGYRVHYNYITLGGVRSDLAIEDANMIADSLARIRKELEALGDRILSGKVAEKLDGIGKISSEDVLKWGVVGPIARASSLKFDVRTNTPYEAYGDIEWSPVIDNKGDCLARLRVRYLETLESIDMCLKIIDMLKRIGGAVRSRLSHRLKHDESFMRVEAPRGELFYYAVAENAIKPLSLVIRTPTYANLQILPELLKGHNLEDLPAILGSFDPCIACLDRILIIDLDKSEARIRNIRNLR